MTKHYETTIQDTIAEEAPSEATIEAMYADYQSSQPPTFTIGAANLLYVVLDEDPIIHTDASPFCQDRSCPCHQDEDLRREYAAKPIERGHLTDREARRLWLSEVL